MPDIYAPGVPGREACPGRLCAGKCKNMNMEKKYSSAARLLAIVLAVLMMLLAAGCSASEKSKEEETPDPGIEDGTYVATFKSDHAMFHVSDANNDKGILTVKDGKMTIHVSLQSKKIVNLFYGPKEEAEKDGAELIEPTTDTVYYDDGTTAEVYGFDVPVPYLDKEFDVSILGTHGNWYGHKVVVSDPVLGDDIHAGSEMDLEDGEYEAELTLEGGTGRASVDSPAKLVVENGEATLTVIWSSPYYDYMIVDGTTYKPVNEEGNSTFEIPVKKLNEPFDVIGDSTAMSEPHEIEYKITCSVKE